MPKYIIFTDLDGTLLDHFTYSFSAASDALKLIKEKEIPLIICTSKTRAEILPVRRRLENKDPFVSENGGAIYIPDKYFGFRYEFQKRIKGYGVIEIGAPHEALLNVFREIRDNTGAAIKGISEMSIREIAAFTGLTKSEAALSKDREYSEPFLLCERGWINRVKKEILKKGFKFTSGVRFFHIMKGNDKGKAVKILKKLYEKKYGKITTVGIGNSLNDLPMLKVVDIPVLVKNYDPHTYSQWSPMSIHDRASSAGIGVGVKVKNLYYADGIGPEGWNRFINDNLRMRIDELRNDE